MSQGTQPLALCSRHVFLDRAHPDVEAAIVIEGGRISAVCSRDELAGISPKARIQDYGDAFLCPGFHDAHQHVFHTALFASPLVCACAGTSEDDCVRLLREAAASRPAGGARDHAGMGGKWLVGQGWRSALWDPPLAPTRASLDRAFPNRPVALYSGDLHALWVNTRGLEELGITEDSEAPAGGSFDRDEGGRPTGVLREAASMAYAARVCADLPRDEVTRAYRGHFQASLSQGVTSVCDMALCALPGVDYVYEDLYEELLAAGELPLRINLFPQNVGDFKRIESLQVRLTGDLLRAPGTKQFFDGVSSAHTAWLHEPYVNPRFEGDCGRATIDPALMRDYVLAAADRGIATRVHAIGDKAVSSAIDIFREAKRRYGMPRQGANSIEHVEGLLHADVAAMADIGLVASVQPQHIVIDVEQPVRDLGTRRASFMWPFASFDEAGVAMAFGTDAPCVHDVAMQVLSCAVTREEARTCEPRGGWLPEQRVTMATAIDAYTRGSAKVTGREAELGTLAAGKLADLAVFDTNLMCADPEAIQGTRALATYVGGRLAWEA